MSRQPATHCTTCGVELTEETASRSRTGTFRSACKACTATYTRGWSQRSLAATDVCSVCAGSGVLTPKGRVRLDATDRDHHGRGAWDAVPRTAAVV